MLHEKMSDEGCRCIKLKSEAVIRCVGLQTELLRVRNRLEGI